MNRISNTSQILFEVLVFYRKKNIKLQPVTPLMPLEALLIPVNPTNSDYDGIIGGTGCNFIFFFYFGLFFSLARFASFVMQSVDIVPALGLSTTK